MKGNNHDVVCAVIIDEYKILVQRGIIGKNYIGLFAPTDLSFLKVGEPQKQKKVA